MFELPTTAEKGSLSNDDDDDDDDDVEDDAKSKMNLYFTSEIRSENVRRLNMQ